MIRHHHEPFDGNGCPEGLGGEDIPLGGRIFAAADELDALTRERLYKNAFSNEKALAILKGLWDKLLDSKLIDL